MTNPVKALKPSQHSSSEQWRPAIHFSPRKNWINDPNGLVYFEGEYHLFYQYNPHGMNWGHMSWGHAVSSDLLHWEELDVAMPEREFMIFSGSAVVDWENSSGLGDGQTPPLLAIYTAYHEDKQRQTQHLAYSHDRGRSWEEYESNPVLDLDMEHFRDPSIFWHKKSEQWVMVVALPREHKVKIYNSVDLKTWTLASEAGPFGNVSGQWECPSLFEISVDGETETAWVLKVDVDIDMIGSGSGAQYVMGRFDGKHFTPELIDGEVRTMPADFGGDFYAAITWNDLPGDHKIPVWIGWFSNHQTGKNFPTNPWRGCMTLPRKLFGYREDGGLKLGQLPIDALGSLRGPLIPVEDVDLMAGEKVSLPVNGMIHALEFDFKIHLSEAGTAGLVLRDHMGRELVIGFNAVTHEIFVDRTRTFMDFDPKFAAKHAAPLPHSNGVTIKIIVDQSSVEVFANGGRQVISSRIFPDGLRGAELFVKTGMGAFRDIHIHELAL